MRLIWRPGAAQAPSHSMPTLRPAASTKPSLSQYPLLDGLRGCAIMLVLASHLIDGVPPANRFDDVVLRLFSAGWVGVDPFLVLSWFLITGILLDSRDDGHRF